MRAAVIARRRRERGVALIACLWFLVLLSVLAASYQAAVRADLSIARNAASRIEAEALADAGVHRVIAALGATGQNPPYRVDGSPYAWGFADGQVRFFVEDESGKIDLNEAETYVLRAALQLSGGGDDQVEAIVAAIARLRGEDDDGARVENAGGQRPGATAFVLVEQMMQLPGMTGDLYAEASPLFTVHSGLPAPTRETASAEVRAVLDRIEGGVGQDGAVSSAQLATSAGRNDRRARLAASIGRLRQSTGRDQSGDGGGDVDVDVDEEEQDDAGLALEGVFTIHAEGRTESGAVFSREAVVRVIPEETPPYAILAWRQGPRWLFPVERAFIE